MSDPKPVQPADAPASAPGLAAEPRSHPGAPARPAVTAPPATAAVRHLLASEIPAFVEEELFSPARRRPVVAVSSWPGERGFPLDPAAVAAALGDRAIVVAIRTGEDTWALSSALPGRLDVFGGASRIWWPGLTRTSNPLHHPLLFIWTLAEAPRVLQRIVAAVVDGDPRAGRYGAWGGGDARPVAGGGAAGRSGGPADGPAHGPARAEGGPPGPAEPPDAGFEPRGAPAPLRATVTSVEGAVVRVRVRGEAGFLTAADEPIASLAAKLKPGLTVPVSRLRTSRGGVPCYSAEGLLTFREDGTPVSVPARPPATPRQIADAVVVEAAGESIRVRVHGVWGDVVEADVPVGELARELRQGMTLRVRRLDAGEGDVALFSAKGLAPDPWRRLADVCRVGDVVRGRICRIEDRFVLVELLPGAMLVAPVQELDYSYVRHPSDVVRVGEHVRARIVDLDAGGRRGSVSLRQALAKQPGPAISPGPGQPPFLADGEFCERRGESPEAPGEEASLLRAELEQANTDRASLRDRVRQLQDQLQETRRAQRSAEDALRHLGQRAAGDLEPLANEAAFLTAVRVEYARRADEGSRQTYPLAAMRVGREFLATVRATDGVSVEKIVEVCAQVACQRAHLIPGREVHPLRAGAAGAQQRLRASDGARAWRCSLQDNTASARRLHWWDIPGRDGRTIEFASVGVHDEMEIPG